MDTLTVKLFVGEDGGREEKYQGFLKKDGGKRGGKNATILGRRIFFLAICRRLLSQCGKKDRRFCRKHLVNVVVIGLAVSTLCRSTGNAGRYQAQFTTV